MREYTIFPCQSGFEERGSDIFENYECGYYTLKAVSFVSINPPLDTFFFFFSVGKVGAITHKKRLIACYAQEVFFPRLYLSASLFNSSAILRAN